MNCYCVNLPKKSANKVISILPIEENKFSAWLNLQADHVKNLVRINNFCAKPNSFCFITNSNGNLEKVLLGIESIHDYEAFGILPEHVPEGLYRIDAQDWNSSQLTRAVIGWGLGSYQFIKYKNASFKKRKTQLVLPQKCDTNWVKTVIETTYLVRDIINTPAHDIPPSVIANVAFTIAREFGAKIKQIVGDDLLTKNFPAIHAVGRGSAHLPRLIEFEWGNAKAPKVVLVGKGVCFDSGGLNLKSHINMLHMKTDMAGAAHALGLARMIMSAELPVHLQVIIPAVENMVSGASYKPGDVIKTRKGLTVEIYDTDAEGRVILADALAYACESNPELVLNFASLTGAAVVALGSKITALFSDNDDIVTGIVNFTAAENELAWRMPLYKPYLKMLNSSIADIANSCSSREAGAIRAALFLREFITDNVAWVHLDMHGMNDKSEPAHPEGADAVCLKGLFKYLKHRYS